MCRVMVQRSVTSKDIDARNSTGAQQRVSPVCINLSSPNVSSSSIPSAPQSTLPNTGSLPIPQPQVKEVGEPTCDVKDSGGYYPDNEPPTVSYRGRGLMHTSISLPRIEVVPFSGDPGEYRTFVREFSEYVESYTSTDSERLCHLVRLCKGPAAEAIRGCRDMPPSKGLAAAKQALQEQFGTDRKVEAAVLQRLLNGREGNLIAFENSLCCCTGARRTREFK